MKQEFKPMDIVYCKRNGIGIVVDNSQYNKNTVVACFEHGGIETYDKNGKTKVGNGNWEFNFPPDELDITHYKGKDVLYTLDYNHDGRGCGESFMFYTWDDVKKKIEELASIYRDSIDMESITRRLFADVNDYGIAEVGVYKIGDELKI